MSMNFDAAIGPIEAPNSSTSTGWEDVLIIGGWRVEPYKNQLTCDDQIHRLQPRLTDLLVYLFENRSCIVSRDEILNLYFGRNAAFE